VALVDEARLRRWHGAAERERGDQWGLAVALLLCGLVAMGICSRALAGW
jgi:hypothetical protein